MNALANALLSTLAAGILVLAVPGPVASESPPTTATTPIGFGMSASAVAGQSAAGVKPDYGTFWIGPWTLSSGWGGPDSHLAAMKSAGVTPAIHFYYWGDDISPSCVENGCWSDLHNAHKDRAGWERLGTQLTDHLHAKLGGAPAVILLESEFNKGGIEKYEPFDGYMAAMADKIHAAYPNAIIVLGFGNWGSAYWGNFDRAAAASDMVGIQSMRGSTRQSQENMMTLYDSLLSGTKTLGSKFPGKPVMITDMAVSSYPEPDYIAVQRDVVKEVFDNLQTLKAAGVKALIYRSWKDTPTMDTANWYGQAERHWGLSWAANGTLKPSGHVWVAGVQAERAGSTGSAPATPAPAPSTPYEATFKVGSGSNEWWVEAYVTGSPAPTKVEAKAGDAAWRTLAKQSWGGWASSFHVPKGTMVEFRATASDGRTDTSEPAPWLGPAPAPAPPPNAAPTASFTATAKDLTASFDGAASSDPEGSALTYAWSFGDGTTGSGRTATHAYAKAGTYTAQLTVSDGSLTSTATKSVAVTAPPPPTSSSSSSSPAPTTPTSGYQASFRFDTGANEWWMETKVSASPMPAKVEVKVGSGAWTPLRQRDSDTWGEEMHVKKGTPVAFRATAPDGRVATAPAMAYLGTGTTTGTSPSVTSPSTSSTPTTAPVATFPVTFVPKGVGIDWWVETRVSTSGHTISKVEAKVDGGAWTVLPKTAWGTYAKSIYADDGSKVVFRATSSTGAVATSATYTWT